MKGPRVLNNLHAREPWAARSRITDWPSQKFEFGFRASRVWSV